jgi:cytochrome P450
MTTNAQPPWVQDLDPPRYVIVSARVSPMVELARWLFERHHIPYEEERHAPLLHVPFTLRRKGGVEVPVIVSAASTWKGARETLHGLDSRLRAGERLFGDEADERQRNIAFVDQLLARLLLNVRRLAYFHLLPIKGSVVPVATDGVPAWERAIVWIFFPIWRRLMGRALDFSPAAIGAAPGHIAEAFDLVEAALQERGTRFLGGNAPNAIDIMFSALVAPLTLPIGYGSKLPTLEELPSALRRFVDSLQARRGGQLVFDTYAAARPAPQAPLKRPRRDRTLAQRLLGPGVQQRAARAAVAFSKPFVFKKFALVSRWTDVQSVLELDLPFRIQPINGPNFDAISGPFVLGLDRGPQFARERRQMYESVARIDSNDMRARISHEADRILDVAVATSGKIDVAHGYAHPVAARTAAHLFGIPGPTEADLMRVCRALFHFSFLANPDDTRVEARARRAAAEMRTWMTDEIARRRRDRIAIDDVLGRLLAIQDASGVPLDGETARCILVGLLVGAIDTTAPTVPRIVCVLASDPTLLAQVERDIDDRQRMLGWCSEALRMWSSAPVLFRRSSRATTIGGRTIGEGFKVAAFTQAAMFDPSVFPLPTRLDPARSQRHYLNFGGGLHPCAGRGVNDVQLPELVSRLVARGITSVGSPRFVGPFIDEFVVTFRRPQP